MEHTFINNAINLLDTVDDFGNTKLHIMALSGDTVNIAIILLHKRVASVRNNNGDTPLHFLGCSQCREILYHPKTHKVKNKDGNTPLHMMALRGGHDIVMLHKHAGKVVNKNKETPLHISARCNYGNIVFHEDVNLKEDKTRKTPLDILISFNNEKVLEYPRITECDCYGKTLLHKIAKDGHSFVVNHPSVHIFGDYTDGRTALHELAIIGDTTILNHRHHDQILDFHDLTPLDYLCMSKEDVEKMTFKKIVRASDFQYVET